MIMRARGALFTLPLFSRKTLAAASLSPLTCWNLLQPGLCPRPSSRTFSGQAFVLDLHREPSPARTLSWTFVEKDQKNLTSKGVAEEDEPP